MNINSVNRNVHEKMPDLLLFSFGESESAKMECMESPLCGFLAFAPDICRNKSVRTNKLFTSSYVIVN